MSRLLTIAGMLLVSAGFAIACAAPATAHAKLLAASPPPGASLATSPNRVVLVFDERVIVASGNITVTGPAHRRVDRENARTEPGSTQAVVDLRSNLPAGRYQVAFHVISADSHAIAGSYAFGIRTAPAPSGVETVRDDPAVSLLLAIARLVAYVGVVLAVGLGTLIAVEPGIGAHAKVAQLIRTGLLFLAASAVALGALQVAQLSGQGLQSVTSHSAVRDVVTSRYGVLLLVRTVAAALAFIATRSTSDPRHRSYRAGAIAMAIVVAVTFADAGHAAIDTRLGLSVAADTVHTLCAATWLAGASLLALDMQRGNSPLDVVRTHSRLSAATIPGLVATGAYQAAHNVGSWHALATTRYGHLVTAKVGAAAVIVEMGLIARRRLLPKTEADRKPQQSAALRRIVLLDVVLGSVVLVLTTLLVATPTPR